MYPSQHGAWSLGTKLYEDVPVVSDRFREAGYFTSLIGKAHFQPLASQPGMESIECQPILRDLDFWRNFHGPWYGFEHVETARMHACEHLVGQHYAIWMEENGLPNWRDYFEDWPPNPEKAERLRSNRHWPLPEKFHYTRWTSERTIAQIERAASEDKPFFLWSSYHDPHPPFAPPVPFNRMYDPDRMPDPIHGDIETDHMDEQIPWMNRIIWADGINDSHARVLKARYYGEISYIDDCLGRILDAVDARDDADNTLICFFADHGDGMGDHSAWQKESFFEAACHVPFLLSWPKKLPANERRDELVCLADLFGIATHAAGQAETRDGMDVLKMLDGNAEPRQFVVGYYGEPGTPLFKIMIRNDEWKYIFIANGGREQLFNMTKDPQELKNLAADRPDVIASLRPKTIDACRTPGAADALDGDDLRIFDFKLRETRRIYQFDRSRGVKGFPEKPEDVLKNLNRAYSLADPL